MKQLFRILTIILLVNYSSQYSYCQEKIKVKDGKMKTKGGSMDGAIAMDPYNASYSSNFSLGNKKYSSMILDLYKDYENNTFNNHDYFTDSVVIYLSDGNVLKGKKQMQDAISSFRNSVSTIKTDIHAWLPLHVVDKNEDVVCIWATETDTMTDGKASTSEIHEVWWFNKDGKVSVMRQFAAQMPKM